ncbi:MAG: YihY/virulence factor BrkB family protein [Verrucomicrobia bacterium]|nr:YihY/virulence factor BrkB family protein [Verrucomicrobiota bacterium]
MRRTARKISRWKGAFEFIPSAYALKPDPRLAAALDPAPERECVSGPYDAPPFLGEEGRYVQSVDLGGLSLYDLLKRTARASWHNAVFGQGSRMAFYHFLALFPTLLLVFLVARHLPSGATPVRDTLLDWARPILPPDTVGLLQGILNELQQHAQQGVALLPALSGAVWALGNGLWALIVGLNTAYEVQERRPWWKLALTMVGLTLALTLVGSLALGLLVGGAQLGRSFSQHSVSPLVVFLTARILPWFVLLACYCSAWPCCIASRPTYAIIAGAGARRGLGWPSPSGPGRPWRCASMSSTSVTIDGVTEP